MAEYEITFPTPQVATREEFDAHADQLDDLKNQLWAEINRLEQIRIKGKLYKTRYREDLEYEPEVERW